MKSHLYHKFCITCNFLISLRLVNFQTNKLSCGSQCSILPYKKALLNIFSGNYSTSLVTRISDTLLTATGIFISKLLTSTLQHFSKYILLFCEVYNCTEIRCTNSSSFNKLKNYSHIILHCWESKFQFVCVATHSRFPSQSMLPSLHSYLHSQLTTFLWI